MSQHVILISPHYTTLNDYLLIRIEDVYFLPTDILVQLNLNSCLLTKGIHTRETRHGLLIEWKKKLWNRQFKRLGMQFYAQQLENKITRTRHITKPMKFLK
jgi:hypothetical protein